MKIEFQGTATPDETADAFILAFLASRKGSPVSAPQVWKSLRSRGFTPTTGGPTEAAAPDDAMAETEIARRLALWAERGLVGGEAEVEAITQERHYWVIGSARSSG
jgi:hypothetical protein